jgi:hypothetical protein
VLVLGIQGAVEIGIEGWDRVWICSGTKQRDSWTSKRSRWISLGFGPCARARGERVERNQTTKGWL